MTAPPRSRGDGGRGDGGLKACRRTGPRLATLWSRQGGGDGLSHRVLRRVRPGAPLESRIRSAQANLGGQIAKLDSIHAKLQRSHDRLFARIVDAKKAGNEALAAGLSSELAQQRKVLHTVHSAKLAMEQVQIRLSTMSELGDVVVALSPCMSVLKDVGGSLGGVMPAANDSMQDLSRVLGDVLAGSSVGGGELVSPAGGDSAEASAILEEAHSVIEGRARTSLPDPPASLKNDVMQRRQSYA